MPPLDQVSLEDAIQELVDLRRKGHDASPQMVVRVAADHDVRPDALQLHFERQFPDGDVGSALPTEAENRERKVLQEVAAISEQYHRLGAKVDGSTILLDGEPHTIIAEIRHKKRIILYNHSRMREVNISYARFKSLKVSRTTRA